MSVYYGLKAPGIRVKTKEKIAFVRALLQENPTIKLKIILRRLFKAFGSGLDGRYLGDLRREACSPMRHSQWKIPVVSVREITGEQKQLLKDFLHFQVDKMLEDCVDPTEIQSRLFGL